MLFILVMAICLTYVHKFCYLKGALEGEVKELLRDFHITDASYTRPNGQKCQKGYCTILSFT